MTRKEERKKAAFAKYGTGISREYDGFLAGAQWADKTMIDKACIWLKHNAKDFTYISAHSGDAKINAYKLIEEFEKAMEE